MHNIVNSVNYKKLVNVGSFSIDSFRVRIPIQKVSILNSNLNQNIISVNEKTGEQIDKFKLKAFEYQAKGYSIWYRLEEYTMDKGSRQKFLVILISAKILEHKYFEGINKNNIRSVFDKIISHRVIDCSYDDFCLGVCSDIDIKVDYYLNDDEYDKLLKYCIEVTRESKISTKGYLLFGTSNSHRSGWGLQWSKRTSTKYRTNPFMKFYDKWVQLENVHKEFKERYLYYNLIDLKRFEFNIKNKKHFNWLTGSESVPTIETIMSLNKRAFVLLCRKTMKTHLETSVRLPNEAIELSPTDTIIYNLICGMLLNSRLNYKDIEKIALTSFEDKVKKSRAKKRVKDLYQLTIDKNEEVKRKLKTSDGRQFFINLFGEF